MAHDFSEEREERKFTPNMERGHLGCDKLLRKGGHLEWDGGSDYQSIINYIY